MTILETQCVPQADSPPAPTIAAAVKTAVRALMPYSDSPRLDAEILLSMVLKVTRTMLIVREAQPLGHDDRLAYEGLIARRAAGAPVAYLTGVREFWSLEFDVTPAVLVPRPETEVLVELALQSIPRASAPPGFSVLDLGTGSGAIALAIASQRPAARITGVDVSASALSVAKANAHKFGVHSVRWLLGSWFEPVGDEFFDIIVANPPYVAAGDPALARLRSEPALALSPGPTGLEAIANIVAVAPAHLRPGGRLMIEHGCAQASVVARLLADRGFDRIRAHQDYSGNDRITSGYFHSLHEEIS